MDLRPRNALQRHEKLWRADSSPQHRGAWLLAVAVAFGIILLLTLTPIPGAAERSAQTPLLCLVCGDIGAVDVLNNLLLFLPFGFALRRAGLRGIAVVTLVALTTLAVESAQYWIVPGRDASLSDVLTNTTGGATGVLLANSLALLLRPAGRALVTLRTLAVVIPAGILAGSAWLLKPAPPRSTWFGQWAPDLGQYERFRGRILAASLGGRPLPSGPLRDPVNPAFELQASFVTGPMPSELAPIVSVFDEYQRKVILLGQSGRDLHFEARSRGEHHHFRPLTLALGNALPAEAGDTLSAAGSYDGQTLRVEVSGPAGTRERRLDVSAGLGWALVAPWYGPLGAATQALTALWLVLLWTPLGYYFGRSKRTRIVFVVVPPLLTTTVTVLAGFPFNPWEFAGAGLGILAGYGLNRWSTPQPPPTTVQPGLDGWSG